jgi:hypothetical protein
LPAIKLRSSSPYSVTIVTRLPPAMDLSHTNESKVETNVEY